GRNRGDRTRIVANAAWPRARPPRKRIAGRFVRGEARRETFPGASPDSHGGAGNDSSRALPSPSGGGIRFLPRVAEGEAGPETTPGALCRGQRRVGRVSGRVGTGSDAKSEPRGSEEQGKAGLHLPGEGVIVDLVGLEAIR